MHKFLTLKHWQLFTLLMGVPIIGQLAIIASVIATKNPAVIMYAFPLLMIVAAMVFYGWFYAIGSNLHKKLPSSVKMSLTRFKIFLFIPAVYMISMSVFMNNIFAKMESGGQPDLAIFAFIFPLHLFSMFCMFYCLYFNAKVLKAVELQKPVSFSDYAGEFFLIWMFPIGVWIIQPRINKIFQD